jgi:hypothetical protein
MKKSLHQLMDDYGCCSLHYDTETGEARLYDIDDKLLTTKTFARNVTDPTAHFLMAAGLVFKHVKENLDEEL